MGSSGGGGFNNVNITRGSYQPTMGARTPNAPAVKPGANQFTGVNADTGPNVFNQSARNIQQAQNRFRNPGQLGGNNLNQYMNPYTTGAINATMGDIDRNRQMQVNQLGANAQQAGAFGGSRHGVAEALTNEAATRQMADTSAQMRNQGWGQAQQAKMFDIGNTMQAGQNLANLGQQQFGIGQAINQQQQQQGAMQQALQQQLINAGKSQFQGFTGAPGQSLQYPLAALGTV